MDEAICMPLQLHVDASSTCVCAAVKPKCSGSAAVPLALGKLFPVDFFTAHKYFSVEFMRTGNGKKNSKLSICLPAVQHDVCAIYEAFKTKRSVSAATK